MVNPAFLLFFVIFRACAVEGAVWRIIRGEATKPNEIPFIVALIYHSQPYCAGSLITLNHILTAGHCVVVENPHTSQFVVIDRRQLKVMAGEVSLEGINTTKKKDCQSVRKITPHFDYNPIIVENDIAIVELYQPFIASQQIQIIPIATSTPEYQQKCFIAGWGATVENSSMEVNLRQAYIEIKDILACNSSESYKGTIPAHTICAGDHQDITSTGVSDACQGDSGGPLVCNKVLAGVISFGTGCGIARYPGIYTDVSQFQIWIDWVVNDIKGSFREYQSSIMSHSKLSSTSNIALLIIANLLLIIY